MFAFAAAVVLTHAPVWAALPVVTIQQPTANQLVTTSVLHVTVAALSSYPIVEITAQVDSSKETIMSIRGPDSGGDLSLSGVTTGNKTLTVTATDQNGYVGTSQVNFVYDLPPDATLALPKLSLVDSPVHLIADCTAHGAPCSTRTVSVSNGNVIATGAAHLDTFVSMPPGALFGLVVTATDTLGTKTQTTYPWFVVNDPAWNLSLVYRNDSFGGGIHDFDGTRLLFVSDTNSSVIHDLTTSSDTVVPLPVGSLTPQGMIAGGSEWRNGSLVPLNAL